MLLLTCRSLYLGRRWPVADGPGWSVVLVWWKMHMAENRLCSAETMRRVNWLSRDALPARPPGTLSYFYGMPRWEEGRVGKGEESRGEELGGGAGLRSGRSVVKRVKSDE